MNILVFLIATWIVQLQSIALGLDPMHLMVLEEMCWQENMEHVAK